MRIPTEKEITDLSKADAFTKAFACIQSSWLIIQSIVRVSVGLPITQLELATMAFVVCALIMYLLWWHTPFGVERRVSTPVIAQKERIERVVADNLLFYSEEGQHWRERRLLQKVNFDRVNPRKAERSREFYQEDLTFEMFMMLLISGKPINDSFAKRRLIELRKALGIMLRNVFGNPDFAKPPRGLTRTIVLYASGMLFSALHVAAWNWEFPSSTSRELWRIFAIAATGTGPVTILAMLAINEFNTGRLEIFLVSFSFAAYSLSTPSAV